MKKSNEHSVYTFMIMAALLITVLKF